MKDRIFRICIALIALSLCMFLVGCKNTEKQEELQIEGEEQSMKVTMEYICSEYGMSESDFE